MRYYYYSVLESEGKGENRKEELIKVSNIAFKKQQIYHTLKSRKL